MNWTGFKIDGQYFDLTHLQPNTIEAEIDGNTVKLHISYSNHCFTDEKENGRMIFKREKRYWCHDRYQRSKELPDIIENKLLEHYAVPYYTKGRDGEGYHFMEVHDYAIFFSLSKQDNTQNELQLKVNSAYELDNWGKHSRPKGNAKRVSWIISQRLKGYPILKRR